MSEYQEPKAEGGVAQGSGDQPSEEELRAKIEEEMKRVTVRDLLLQSCVALANLGFSRLGLNERTREVRDLEQARTAIEALRSLVPLLEAERPEEVKPLRDGLAQMQMAYAQVAAESAESAERGAGAPEGGEATQQGEKTTGKDAGSEQAERPKSSGRIWVPPGTET